MRRQSLTNSIISSVLDFFCHCFYLNPHIIQICPEEDTIHLITHVSVKDLPS